MASKTLRYSLTVPPKGSGTSLPETRLSKVAVFSAESAPQNRIEQNRIEKNRIDQIISDQSTGSQADRRVEDETPYDEKKAPSLLDIFRYVLDNKLINVEPSSFWNHYEARNWCDDLGAPIRDWHALIRKWDLTTPPLT